MLFWNWWILWRATIPSWYLCGLFNSPALRNSFLMALPPTIGWGFFQAAPPQLMLMAQLWWPSQPTVSLGMTLETSHPLQFLHLLPPLLHLAWSWGALFSCRCYKFCRGWRFCRCCVDLQPCSNLLGLSLSPFGSHLCLCHAGIKNQPIKN